MTEPAHVPFLRLLERYSNYSVSLFFIPDVVRPNETEDTAKVSRLNIIFICFFPCRVCVGLVLELYKRVMCKLTGSHSVFSFTGLSSFSREQSFNMKDAKYMEWSAWSRITITFLVQMTRADVLNTRRVFSRLHAIV